MSDFDETPPDDPYSSEPVKVDEQLFTEQSVLGGMMLSARACADVMDVLRSQDFHVPRHALIFDALTELAKRGDPADVVAVTDELIKTGELQRAGGADYLHTLTSVVPTASNAGYYAGIVRDRATLRGLAEIGMRAQSGQGSAAALLSSVINDATKLRDETAAGTDGSVQWLGDLLNVPETADAYDWVIPGVVERRDRLMLSASEGAGKSTLLRQLGILPAAGIHPFSFSPIPPVRVLVIDAENSEKQWRRKARGLTDQAQMRGQRDPRGSLAVECVSTMDLTNPVHLGKIHRWMDVVRPDLLILGPLYRMTKGSLNSDEEVEPVLRALDELRERDVAMLIEVHAGHARSKSGERELRPRGSSALLGWPEFGLGLRRDRELSWGRHNYSLVRWRGDRDERDWPTLTRGQIFPWEPTGAI